MRNKPLLNRCVRQRRKIEDTALCRVAQQTFRQANGTRAKAQEREPVGYSCACFQRMFAVEQHLRRLCGPPSYPIQALALVQRRDFSSKTIRSRAWSHKKAGRGRPNLPKVAQ